MKILELFSGTESFSKVARERGHKTFTIDNDKQFNPDLCIDIMDFKIDMLPEEFRHPDIIWASPPCQKFSVMTIYRNWKDGKPINKETRQAIKVVKKTIEIIKELKPKYFIIENPRAMLRKQKFMLEFKRDTVTYCKYGLEYQKATDLWNNLNHKFRPICSAGDPCHVRAPRGSTSSIQGNIKSPRNTLHYDLSINRYPTGYRRKSLYPTDMGDSLGWNQATLRGIIPPELCLEIIKACEENEPKTKE